MINVTFRLKGLAATQKKFRAMNRNAQGRIDEQAQHFTQWMAKFMSSKPYPTPLPAQKYKRTGLLGRSFFAQKMGIGSHAVSNSAPGREWAIGRIQARIHKKRWWRMVDVVEEHLPGMLESIAADLISDFGPQVSDE